MKRRWDVGFLFVLVTFLVAAAAFAQNSTPPTGSASAIVNLLGSIDPTVLCLGIGALIAAAVKWAKALPLVARFPKTTAFVLSGVAAFAQHLVFGDGKMGTIATCIVTQLVGAIGTHEVLLSSQSVPARAIAAVKADATIPGPPRA